MLGMFGTIDNPFGVLSPDTAGYQTDTGGGLIVLFTSLIRFAVVVAGLYTLLNLVLAGYGYLSAQGDAKKVQNAHDRIWRSFLGLLIVAGSILIGGLMGFVIFGPDGWDLLINPVIYGPQTVTP